MNPLRRVGTPESEAVASSEDEKPWPSSTSFGSLPRKENGMPGLGGGIWGHGTQKRGSFKLSEAAQRNAARDIRLGASSLRTANTPSPSMSEGASGSLPFAIPLQPTPKIHRSLSHSQGQRESPQTPGGLAGQGAGALPLGLLAEDNETDADSDVGEQLTHTVSQPPIGALQRSATYSTAYGLSSGAENGGDHSGGRLQAALSQLTLEPQQRRSQWESHLGWSDLPNVNESRRHSLADIPTRRGSLSDEGYGTNSFSHLHNRRPVLPPSGLGPNSREHGRDQALQILQDHSMRASDGGERFTIPDMYKVPFVSIGPEELSPDDVRRIRHFTAEATASNGRYPGPSSGIRPRKLLFVVSFKCSRVEIFFLLEGTGLNIREGDIVIVEADRGQDLGTVQHANVTPDQARLYKRKYAEEQYKWLMMFSINNAPSNVNPNAQLYGENTSRGLLNNAPSTMQGMPRENFNNLKPKAIKRLANAHEIRMLAEKEGNEAKAKRTCQQKVAHLHLQMEILDAEWQWDFQKLIFYYYADHYINFKDLITELYRIYKTRIWLSAVNPASFSQHAMGQPPSGIGPGAITPYNGGLNNTYTMAYGADPDPYGAVPPYRVGYDTYDPNYPSIPGMPNSFAPGAPGNSLTPTAAAFQPATDPNNSAPTAPPGSIQTGNISDYNYFYDRNNDKDKMVSPTSAGGMSVGAQQNQFMNPYWQGTLGQYAGPVGSPTVEMPGRPNFRNFSPSPWSNATATTGAPGLPGRQTEAQLPIGTARPKSNGGNNQGGVPLPDYMRQASNNQSSFGSNQASFNSHQPTFMNQTRYGAGDNRGNAGQAEAGSSSHTGNWVAKQSYADEMSRER